MKSGSTLEHPPEESDEEQLSSAGETPESPTIERKDKKNASKPAKQRKIQQAEGEEEDLPRKKGFYLTNEEEDTVIDWYNGNELFYDQGHKDFKNGKKKDQLMTEKAMEYGYTGQQLKTWFTNMRTMFGKMLRRKSRQGAKPWTARQTWCLERFNFLKKHVQVRTTAIQMGSVSMSCIIKK